MTPKEILEGNNALASSQFGSEHGACFQDETDIEMQRSTEPQWLIENDSWSVQYASAIRSHTSKGLHYHEDWSELMPLMLRIANVANLRYELCKNHVFVEHKFKGKRGSGMWHKGGYYFEGKPEESNAESYILACWMVAVEFCKMWSAQNA